MAYASVLERRKHPFYCDYEQFSEDRRQTFQREKLEAIISYARTKSAFYKNHFSDLNIDKNARHPLAHFPVVSAADIRPEVPPTGTGLITTSNQARIVFQSGGTTGVPKTSLFTYQEMELINECNARGFVACGMNENDRVANMWAVGSLYMTFLHMHRIFSDYGCTTFPFSNHTPADFVHTVAKMFQINCFSGITSVVLNCLRKIYEIEPDCLEVKKIFFGGEHIYEADRLELTKRFGVKQILAPGYGTVDSWYIGYQCEACPNGTFHAFDDMVHIEMLHEDTGRVCEKEEIGLLHVTAMERRLMPIIRFKVGDKAKWLDKKCACGRTTPLFQLLGRGDDVLRVGYDSVDYQSMQDLIVKFGNSSGALQMEKKRREGKDQLILRIETDAPKEAHADMSRRFYDLLLLERPSIRDFIAKSSIWPVMIEWWAPATLPQNPRTGKLIRVIDSL